MYVSNGISKKKNHILLSCYSYLPKDKRLGYEGLYIVSL